MDRRITKLLALLGLVLLGGCFGEIDQGNNPPAAVTSAVVTEIAGGLFHTCALLAAGNVKCWGRNSFGQLGQGDIASRGDDAGEMGDALLPVELGASRNAVQIDAGGEDPGGTSCALLADGTIKCWGDNFYGELGLGHMVVIGDNQGEMGDNLPGPDLGSAFSSVAMSFGLVGTHVCAISSNSEVKCWGSGGNTLGLEDLGDRGDEPGEMGDALPVVDLGTGAAASAIAVSSIHSCAILDDGSVKCWGGNGLGQLGLEDTTARGAQVGDMGNNLSTVDLGSGRTASKIFADNDQTCVILDNGETKCWGENFYGQLGQGDTNHRGDSPNEMGDFLSSIDFGTGRAADEIAIGEGHICALLDDGDVKCWGRNDHGQLGLGDIVDRGDVAGEMGDNLPAVDLGATRTAVAIGAGGLHTCAILDDGSVKCWGDNRSGQLGLGGTATRGDQPGEMGDNLEAVDLGAG